MRSYIHCYRSPDFKTLVKWRDGINTDGYENVMFIRDHVGTRIPGFQPNFCRIYTNICLASFVTWYDENMNPLDLGGGWDSPLNIANLIYNIQPFSDHPKN